MADFDPILRLILQEYGENPDAWGGQLNTGALTRVGEAFTMVAVTVNANVTLTVENGLSDQARRLGFIFSGAGGFQVTHPAIAKPYLLINNCAADITFKPQGGTGATIRAGTKVWYFTSADGLTGFALDYRISDFLAANKNIAIGNYRITGLADGVDPTDATTMQQIAPFAASAAASAASALADKNATALLYNDFQKRYLGPYATDPTVDNLGNPLAAGALYFNTGAGQLRAYNGVSWLAITVLALSSQAQAEAGVDNSTAMSPLRVSQAIAALAGNAYTDVFSSSGTWTKRSGAKLVYIICLGAGGGGGCGARAAAGNQRNGGNGGGGGSWAERLIPASALGSTESISIGAGGTGAAGLVSNGSATNGGAGGDTTFGAIVIAKGGGAGLSGGNAHASSNALFAGSSTVAAFGGADGGGGSSTTNGSSSILAAGGGGGGGGVNSANATWAPGVGGTTSTNTTGGGGAAGTSGTSGTNGSAGSSILRGGGGGGSATGSGAAGSGGNGSLGGGGGGGGGGTTGNSGSGGNGGNGLCIAITFM